LLHYVRDTISVDPPDPLYYIYDPFSSSVYAFYVAFSDVSRFFLDLLLAEVPFFF
jgi:hypothetical protein